VSAADLSIREVGIAATRAGGEIVRTGWGQARSVRFKGEKNLVTEYDQRSEAAIVAVIRDAFPDHRILAEEGSMGGSDPRHRWLIDPLDGTTNFAHGCPFVGVSVACERDGELVFGAILDPLGDELFVAERGRGAVLNGRPIAVSATPTLERALLVTGFPYGREHIAAALASWNRFIPAAQAVRRLGAAALDLAYVAAGRLDGFWESHLGPWDCAAGAVLVAEAGGRVTDYSGGRFEADAGQCLASNGLIHDEMARLLADPS